jgi:hypothetical protein
MAVGFPSKFVTLKGFEKCVLKRQEGTAGLRDGSNSGHRKHEVIRYLRDRK